MNAKQANRAARRAAQNARPRYLRGTKEEKMRKLMQNGITPEMLKDEYKDGFDAGVKAGVNNTFRGIYASVMLAAREICGFGPERVLRLIRRVDELVCTSMCDEDAVREVWDKLGVMLDFREGVDRIKEKER